MATLASATLDIARLITMVVEGTSTGGTTATLIDTGFPYLPDAANVPANDYYNQGTIWFLSSTLIGKSAVVTDWVRSTTTGTASFATQTASATATQYAICDRTYPRYILRQGVNQALAEIGGEDMQNTALTTVSDQEGYDLPAGVYNVLKVEIASIASSPYDYYEVPSNQWQEINDDIKFSRRPQSGGLNIRLTYRVPQSALSADTDALPDLYNPNWVKYLGAAYCFRWRRMYVRNDEPELAQFLGEEESKAMIAAMRYTQQLQRTNRAWANSIFDTPQSGGYPGDQNPR